MMTDQVFTEKKPRVRGRTIPEEKTMKVIARGSTGEAICGLAAVALAILGLAGVLPALLASIAVIVIGAALSLEGGTLAARHSELLSEIGGGDLSNIEIEGGMTTELIGGIAGITLGILALLGVDRLVLLSVSAIVFGGVLLLSSATLSRLNEIQMTSGHRDQSQRIADYAVSSAAGAKRFVGLGGITLGILALIGVAAAPVLTLVAFLAVAVAELISGSAVSGKMTGILHR